MGLKRLREWDDDDDEYSEFLNPRKRLKVSDTRPRVSAREPKLKPRPRLKRSNSIDRSGGQLSISDRHTANTGLKKESMKDYSVITIFSREAFENFGRTWKSKMGVDTLNLATSSSRKGVSDADAKKMLSLQSKTTLGADFQAHVQALLENKTMPHVIAVIEGKEEKPSLQLKTEVGTETLDVQYTRKLYIQGTNAKGSSDNKQSMSIYVRNDMLGVYTVTQETVTHLSTRKKINTAALNYETTDGSRYKTLMVHIPNEFIGTKTKESGTHASFQSYADEQRKGTTPVIVTSYVGDTNYSSAMSEYSLPSMGGHLPSGETLNPQSSGAKKETHFMQSVPLSDGHSKHSVLQPSTTNYVFVNPDDTNREATDHPSVIQYVAHDSELKGKVEGSPLALLDGV
ncbi:hypothetical protein FMM05_02500 [Flavobacterium zepuense]|uniref:Uncharacterized protein n=2 Tax=Flavobacterium zepuense TaxID=2593302 RepID=A0A552VAZ1_9FLAO|nr:hypothetical protein FMM05_02500 [Flavobacterium zepuense]